MYFRMAFVMLIQLYTSRIILDQLGEEGYGLYNVVGGLVVMLTFLNGAMVATSQRFLAYELGRNDHERLRITFSQSFYAHLFIAIIFIIVAETAGLWFLNYKMVIANELKNAANWVFQFSIASFIITLIQVPYGALITAHERLDIYAILGIIDILLRLGVALILFKFSTTSRLIWYAFLIFCVTLVINLAYIWFCRHKFKETRLVKKIDRSIFKSLTSFLGWSIFGSLAWIGKNQGVNIVLNTFLGTIINAAYGVAMQINGAVNSFAQNFISAVNPQVIQSFASGNRSRMIQLINMGSKTSYLLLFIIVFPVFTNIEGILKIWLVEVPEYTPIFLRLILIITLLESLAYVMGTAIQATGRIKAYQIIIGCTLLLNLPASYLLLRLNKPPYAVFFAGILLAFIALIERIFILYHFIPEFKPKDFLRKVFLPITITTLATIFAYLPINMLIAHWGLRLVIAVGLTISTSLLLGTNETEKKHILNISNKLWIKLRSSF